MEKESKPFSFNIFEKAKIFFYHLRFIFCLGSPDETNNISKKKPIKNNIKSLPVDCMVEVFKNLSLKDKGNAAQVCPQWLDIIEKNCLRDVDLTYFKLVCHCQQSVKNDKKFVCKSALCFDLYKTRLKTFVSYLISHKIEISSLKLSFDIMDCDDNWDDFIELIWMNMRLKSLKKLSFDWLQTPEKCQELKKYCGSHINDLQLLQRRRTRKFESIFKMICINSVSLEELSMPFEWTENNVKHISNLKSLKKLYLYNSSDRSSNPTKMYLNILLANLLHLKHLELFVTNSSLHHSSWPLHEKANSIIHITAEHPHALGQQLNLNENCHLLLRILPTHI